MCRGEQRPVGQILCIGVGGEAGLGGGEGSMEQAPLCEGQRCRKHE